MKYSNKNWLLLSLRILTIFYAITVNAQVTLYDQSDVIQGQLGPSSQIFTDLSRTLFAADDFEIPAGKSWNITQIQAFGQKAAGDLGGSVTVNVFSADPSTGLPTDNIVYTQIITPTSAVTNPDIDLAIPSGNSLCLNEGKYWLNVLVSSTVAGRWYWDYNLTGYSNDYYLKDPANLTSGSGIGTSWTASTGIASYNFHSNMAFKLTGTSTNTPSITSTAGTAVNDNATYNYTVTTSDPDIDPVTVTAIVKPTWLSFNGTLLTGSAVGQAGDHNVTLKADDGNGGKVTQTFTITVNDVTAPVFENSTPTVASIAATSFTLNTDINEAGKIYYVAVADGATVPTSAEVKAGTASGGGAAIKSANATVSSGGFTNAFSVTGLTGGTAYDVYTVAEDDHGTPNLQAAPVKRDITTINTAPIFTSTAVTAVNEGNAYTYNIATNDADRDALTVTAPTLPSWLSLTSGTIVSTIAGGGTSAQFSNPSSMVTDSDGNIFVVDNSNHRIRKIDVNGDVTTIAGSGIAGFNDAQGTSAQFNNPWAIVIDAQNNLYVSDISNHRIRKIDTNYNVTTYAGTGSNAITGGTFTPGAVTVDLYSPLGLDIDSFGNLYVANFNTHTISKITTNQIITTYTQYVSNPNYILVNNNDKVVYSANNKLYRKDSQGATPVEIANLGFRISGIDIDSNGNIFVSNQSIGDVRKIESNGSISLFYSGLDSPKAINFENPGELYFIGSNLHPIKKISQNNSLTGTPTSAEVGDHNVTLKAADGNGGITTQSFTITVKGKPTVTTTDATIITASGATVNGNVTANGGATITERGFVYALTTNDSSPTLAEVNSTTVFKVIVTGTTGAFTKVLTGLKANSGYSVIAFATNSVGTTESSIKTFTSINTPPTFTSTAVTSVDEGNAYIYNITTNDVDGDAVTVTATTKPSWLTLSTTEVSTLAGSTQGFVNGTGTTAQFNSPSKVAVDAAGNMYVADSGNHIIRKITPSGVVSTLAGSTQGFANGTGIAAQFSNPSGIAVDASGNVYVSDTNNHKIRKISTTGVVSTLAGSTPGFTNGTGVAARFGSPIGIAIDIEGNVYVGDTGNHKIRKITPNGVVSTLAGSAPGFVNGMGTTAKFYQPTEVSVDSMGNVYVADTANHKIRKITPSGVVSTLAGSVSGFANGTGSTVRFSRPNGVTVDVEGNVYVADTNNHKIRKITIDGIVSTFAGSTPGFANGTENTAKFNQFTGVSIDASGVVYVADTNNHLIRKISQKIVLKGAPTAADIGTHNVVLKVSDGNGGNVNQSFTIKVNDITAPTITKLSPLDEATEITLNSNLVLTFNENIVANTGNITIHDASDDSLIETVSVTSGNVTTTNKVATIKPTVALAYNKNYYVKVAATAFKDAANNNFAGITDKTTWRFATELRIAPTITFANVNKTYGDANFNLAATSNSGGAISYAVISGGTGTAVLSGANNKTVNIGNAGTVTIRATQVTSGMYTASTKDMLLTINKATLLVSAANKTKVYGDVNPVFTFNYLSTSFKNGETYTALSKYPVASSIATTSTNVGMVPITLTGGEADNYDFSYTSGNLTITKAALTATARNITREYGDANPALIIDYLGFKNSDDASNLDAAPIATTTAVVGSNVGSEIISLSAGTDDNYTITSISGKLTISKATLIVTAKNQTINYGDNFSIGFDYGAFKNGEDASVLDTGAYVYIVGVAPYNVGTYVIKPDAVSDNNYTPSYINGTLTVSKAILTATADDKSKEYGDANPAFTISYSGFKGSDSVADIDTAPTAASTATTTTSVGSVGITTIGGTDNNYTISTVNGTLTIGKATLIASADDKSKVFGKANPTFTITYNGFVNTDTATDLDTAPVASTTATNSTPAGTVSISLSAGVDTNYTITNINGTLTILIDTDGDGDPDITDEDDDNDGVLDVDDNSPEIPNSDQQDTDGDGTPDVEEDCDNDGVINYFDTDTTKCTDAITQKKKYGFSPNGDGINETWTIDNIYLYPNNTVSVFNRSGKIVFEQKGYKNTWNGVSNKGGNGQRLPVGPYLFIIEINDAGKKTIQGWLYINY